MTLVDDATHLAAVRLFALVTEALAKSTWALLSGDVALGEVVVHEDHLVDQEAAALERLLWSEVDRGPVAPDDVHRLVGMLLVISELERSADLAEHIAQRAVMNLGGQMTPISRGIVQRMSEVAIQMWGAVAEAYVSGDAIDLGLHETDEELDILHGRLTSEVARGTMDAATAAQVTLLSRFYERIGDHAVNLSRRLVRLQQSPGPRPTGP